MKPDQIPEWALPMVKMFNLRPDSVSVNMEFPIINTPAQPFGSDYLEATQENTGEVIITIKGFQK